jgi:hypothetical protein
MIQIVHTLGGCGGTILSRCIGVLPDIALFSEINPASVNLFDTFDPLYQDRNWTHLLGESDLDHFSRLDLAEPSSFQQLIQALYDRAVEKRRRLVLRDYNYIDFVGVPFCDDPPQRLTLYSALPANIPTRPIAFIRHPVDQWSSLCKHDIVRDALPPAHFCGAYAAFLKELGSIPKHKYEDFAADPSCSMQTICRDLGLVFEPGFLQRFQQFDNVTGDFTRQHETSISAPRRRSVPAHILDEFRACNAYGKILSATGYRD